MDEASARTAIEAAVLEISSEVGYRQTEIAAVLRRSGASRRQFDAHFGSLEECFAAAYSAAAAALEGELSAVAASAPAWRPRLRQVLAALAAWIEREPLRAKALFVEASLAGPDVGERRDEGRRLAIAALRRLDEDPAAAGPPPPSAVDLLVYMVEGAAATALAEGQVGRFRGGLHELTYMLCACFFEPEIARAEAELMAAAEGS